MLGSVLQYADSSFNTILELGFASSIRKEWVWRRNRGESTRNLDAFRTSTRVRHPTRLLDRALTVWQASEHERPSPTSPAR